MSFLFTAITTTTTNCRTVKAFSNVVGTGRAGGGGGARIESRIGRTFGIDTACFSSISPQQQNPSAGEKRIKLRNTGGLRRLPVVKSPTELMNKASKAPKRIKNDEYVR